jgi:hypothetical protein
VATTRVATTMTVYPPHAYPLHTNKKMYFERL